MEEGQSTVVEAPSPSSNTPHTAQSTTPLFRRPAPDSPTSILLNARKRFREHEKLHKTAKKLKYNDTEVNRIGVAAKKNWTARLRHTRPSKMRCSVHKHTNSYTSM